MRLLWSIGHSAGFWADEEAWGALWSIGHWAGESEEDFIELWSTGHCALLEGVDTDCPMGDWSRGLRDIDCEGAEEDGVKFSEVPMRNCKRHVTGCPSGPPGRLPNSSFHGRLINCSSPHHQLESNRHLLNSSSITLLLIQTARYRPSHFDFIVSSYVVSCGASGRIDAP